MLICLLFRITRNFWHPDECVFALILDCVCARTLTTNRAKLQDEEMTAAADSAAADAAEAKRKFDERRKAREAAKAAAAAGGGT